ncbi:molybdopterin-dependent oxidoreductase [Nocardioides sp.]|uniref:molybdopterin-dependent oxidoreductase n=1 Tax=Nocardioides sp. TaxID=35761 RepID=UPI0031FE6D80|nr:oxidoreductase, molybdopterin binding protein [Nocardioides sp.]
MKTSRGSWSVAGLVAGAAGLATSYFLAMVMTIRESPVVAVAEEVIRQTPGGLAEKAIQVVGHKDKTILVVGILILMGFLFAYAGQLARRSWWAPSLVFLVLAGIGGAAVIDSRNATAADVLPVVVGFVTWVVCLSLLTEPLRRAELVQRQAEVEPRATTGGLSSLSDHTRRGFVLRSVAMVAVAGALGFFGRAVGAGRRHVEESRRLLRLVGVTSPLVPPKAKLDVTGISPWMTSADDFYLIHTAIVVPAIEPTNWSLKIHGMVDREIVLSYDDLLARKTTEAWITLNCVSNPVGGPLIGNAWWSGVRIADLLAEAGVSPDADAVLQTSDDGWTCGTPLVALTDNRDAILAIAMNGKPLPIEHGFPVRTIVPGLYGYVSATKWVVEMEVTRFSDFEAYWTSRGWGEMGPVKMSSRIDVPGSGDTVGGGDVTFAGVAWSQHTGIEAVAVAIDGGSWQPAEISHPPTNDSWVQWVARLPVDAGDHVVRVRATDKTGLVQTGVVRDVLPDGATGWHTVDFTVRE